MKFAIKVREIQKLLLKIIMNKKLPNKQKGIKVSRADNDCFATYDLGCAAALTTADFELLTLDRTNPRKVQFVFRRDADIEKVADAFWADRLEQKSRSYWDNVKNLKNRLYSN